jgi:flagellar hook assembly protein FlgD
MFRHRLWPVVCGLTLLVASIGSLAQSGAISVSVTPGSIDPARGEYTRITYTVSTPGNYQIRVKSPAGAIVRSIGTYSGLTAGTRSTVWNGRDAYYRVVPAGTYSVVVSGITLTGAALPTGTGTVVVTGGATPTPVPTSGALLITSVSPTTIDPSKSEYARVSYSVSTTANIRLFARNSAGVVVWNGPSYQGFTAGTATSFFRGKNSAGQNLPNGTYTLVLDGTVATTGAALTPATSPVTVAVATPIPDPTPNPTPDPTPIPAGGELGQIVEGAGAANFQGLRYAGDKFGVAFVAIKSGTLREITMQWKKSSGYGAGTYGIMNFELHTNGSNNYASGTVVGRATGIRPSQAMDGALDGALHFPITATLVAGQVYHLVISNSDPSPGTNWSSPNTMNTRVLPWDGGRTKGPRGAWYSGGTWRPWTPTRNPFNTTGSAYANGSHPPMMFTWTDGTNTGDPYYLALVRSNDVAAFFGSSKAGQLIVWDKPTVTIKRIGLSVGKNGAPAGALLYHFEQVGKGDLAAGTLATAGQVPSLAAWVYATLSQPVTLVQGQTYRLWFESPGSASASSGYFQEVPVGERNPAAWIECSWGGAKSHYQRNTGGSWTSWTNADMTFSLQ